MFSPFKLIRSLRNGDPQSIAFMAVFVFLASVCWFSWTFLMPPQEEALPLGVGRFSPRPAETPLSLGEVLELQRVFLTPEDVANPFFFPQPRRPDPRNPQAQPEKKPEEPGEKPPARPDARENNPPPENKPPEPPPPTTKALTLTYSGLLKRPDETTVALVAVAEENSRKFIRVGDRVGPFTVNEISPEGIQIQQDKGEAIFLPRGKTQRFEVPL